ncbi:regulator of sirC expression with transglutaminase-like and TPR domain [Actinomycetospora succinea]|uniref:Regulator of sirC expression with transglutaminase-like and TPR domain n=1 Tax=Actinomycetospora succinea TaxID=663603 RepID=A0A4V3DAB3_9PSEU|nr:transglutaminase-like domain-containing protein [Actinomycetospora succinea]TDQ61228.1 regulator of sirC expression with transglutaminase-like and TPR domain [Actinomycetospora succinea]
MDDDAARRAAVDGAVKRFLTLVGTGRPDLLEGVLEIARAADPDADVDGARAELDRLASGVGDYDDLVRRLYVEEGFHGDREDYYDPRNSSLTQVLARRAGIPITLAVVCIEVGRRAGLGLEPVGMPGHFLVHPTGALQHLDPFTGEMLDREQCIRRFRESTGLGPEVPFDDALLAPIGAEAVLVRMLTNLRGIHRSRGDLAELGWVLRMRLGLPGVSAVEVAELAEVRGRRAAFREAGELLEEWAEVLPDDAAALRRHARGWRAHLN